MKRFVLMFIVFVMMFGLLACNAPASSNGSTSQDTIPQIKSRVLEVGFGKGDITPTEPVEMHGGVNFCKS